MKVIYTNGELDKMQGILNNIIKTFDEEGESEVETLVTNLRDDLLHSSSKCIEVTELPNSGGVLIDFNVEYVTDILETYEETILEYIPIFKVICDTFLKTQERLEKLVSKWS